MEYEIALYLRYVLPRWNGFPRYCENSELAIDNNLVEQIHRYCAISRKNRTLLGSDKGSRTAAVLFTLTAGCKANQVELFVYLHDLLAELSVMPENSGLLRYLADHWFITHPDHHRPISR